MSAEKRPADDDPSSRMLVKRQNVSSSDGALARLNASSNALVQTVPRTSGLQSPVMELTGHSGEIFAAKFDPTGNLIASGSMDRSILLWRTYGDCENYGLLKGHKGAVLDLQWSRDSEILYSASADTHLASWDLTSGARIRRYIGHEEVINTMDVSKRGEELLVSGSDDSTIGIWDPRTKNAVDYIETDFPITAVAISQAGNEIFSGGIDNDIRVWDLRKKSVVYSMLGHSDTVTSLRVSPDSQSLLSYAMDATVKTWDIRPFAPTERQIRTFDGSNMGIEKNLLGASWDAEGKKIAAGSGDGTANVWSSETGKLLYKLPGHRGTVNCAEFAPSKEPIRKRPDPKLEIVLELTMLVLTASSDRKMLLGELKHGTATPSEVEHIYRHANPSIVQAPFPPHPKNGMLALSVSSGAQRRAGFGMPPTNEDGPGGAGRDIRGWDYGMGVPMHGRADCVDFHGPRSQRGWGQQARGMNELCTRRSRPDEVDERWVPLSLATSGQMIMPIKVYEAARGQKEQVSFPSTTSRKGPGVSRAMTEHLETASLLRALCVSRVLRASRHERQFGAESVVCMQHCRAVGRHPWFFVGEADRAPQTSSAGATDLLLPIHDDTGGSSWAMQSILSTGERDPPPPVFRNAWQRSAAAQWRPPPQNRASVLKPSQAGRTNPPGQSSNRLICPPSDGMIQALPGRERGGTARPRFCNPRPSTRPGRPSSGPPLGPWVSFRCSRCRSVAGTHTAPGLGLTAGGAGGRHRLHACPGAWLFLKKIRRRLSCAGGAGLAAGTATLHEYFLDQYFPNMCNCRGAWVRVDELCPPTSDINLTTHVISFEVRVHGVSRLVRMPCRRLYFVYARGLYDNFTCARTLPARRLVRAALAIARRRTHRGSVGSLSVVYVHD
ncbi:hypothetical protein PCL_04987 [Purpureocillium lilacinum]|uniref:Uncharacterized protein n=1 Tax=Purpureocillium lilacinum TaxID=33203 RepID=A0A2U3DWH4_PURLI|nr:hypothetical protein PCL_04987 [Purpureocillium lilacinum]